MQAPPATSVIPNDIKEFEEVHVAMQKSTGNLLYKGMSALWTGVNPVERSSRSNRIEPG